MSRQPLRLAIVPLLAAALALTGCMVAYETAPQPRPMPPPRPVAPPPPMPPQGVDIGFFYDALDPYGDWLRIEPYGWVWAPNAVGPFWRPYTVGRWVWTDWGWTWVSAERWGWAPYHYGRWVRHHRHGWVWIPGNEWGPAWVAWRHGGGSIGWAPLPPEVRFRAEIGLDWGGIDIDIVIRPDWWCFIDGDRFDQPDVVRWAYPVGRNATVIHKTRHEKRGRVVDRRYVNEGFGREEIERVTRRPVPERRVVDLPGNAGRPAEVVGNDVRVFRPQVREGRPGVQPRRGRVPDAVERPAPAPTPAPPSRPAVRREDPEQQADREWDRKWNQDWRKLERAQQEEERKAPPAARPDPKSRLEQIRTENQEAAENARREQVAARERAKRKAVRGGPNQAVEKDEKKDEKKDGKKDDKKDESRREGKRER